MNTELLSSKKPLKPGIGTVVKVSQKVVGRSPKPCTPKVVADAKKGPVAPAIAYCCTDSLQSLVQPQYRSAERNYQLAKIRSIQEKDRRKNHHLRQQW